MKKTVFILVTVLLVTAAGCTMYPETGCAVRCNQTETSSPSVCICSTTPAPENRTPLPQEVTVSLTATGITSPTGAWSKEPIVGVWRENYSFGYDDRYRFNADGTFIESFSLGAGKKTIFIHGTWSAQGSNAYLLRDAKNEVHATFIYDPEQNVIYPLKNSISVLNPYSGDIAGVS